MSAALVKVDVAAARLGWSAQRLFDLADGGTLTDRGFEWVFNLAHKANQGRRDLRWWWPEIEARALGREFPEYDLAEVIALILPPTRHHFHAGEVDRLFQIRPRTRIDLHAELCGELASGRHFYLRASLAEFLNLRWLAAALQSRR